MAKAKKQKQQQEDVIAQIAEQVMEQDDAPASEEETLEADVVIEEEITEEEIVEETSEDEEAEEAEEESGEEERGEPEEQLVITQDDVRLIEAILFASSSALTVSMMAERFPEERVSLIPDVLEILKEQYASRGVNLVQRDKRWAFRTATELGDQLRLEKEQPKKFTRAAMETMAVIAYHQPVTRAEIENIRGVSTSPGALDALMEAGWVKPGKRREVPGRPVTWLSTQAFLDHFGLEKLGDLPGMEELKAAGLMDKRPAIEAMPTADLFGDDENKEMDDPNEVTDEDLLGKADDENADADFDDDFDDEFDDDEKDVNDLDVEDTEMSAGGGDDDEDDDDADDEEDDDGDEDDDLDSDEHDDYDDEVESEFAAEMEDEEDDDYDEEDDDDDYEDDEDDDRE